MKIDPTTSEQRSERQVLRQYFRKQRNQVPEQQQNQSALTSLQVCLRATKLAEVNTVACYLANDGELDPKVIIEHCWQQNIQVVLPVLNPNKPGHLVFVKYHALSPMTQNIYGIEEPIINHKNTIELQDIDLIFTPLVAFDKNGNRLGMGGGYYDRSLAPITAQKLNIQLIGLAHACQEAKELPVDGWDIPLNGIVTPEQYFQIN
ncbi:5-formyltetrahydrofolate cyclo-ligase [Paraglaciecola sp.]|uniref:5-formyltetrahydrofolate cyclo-ligase n=1 Tax=Paraglaciecola sp. TaxID=1920173 RepID=UPI003EF293CD